MKFFYTNLIVLGIVILAMPFANGQQVEVVQGTEQRSQYTGKSYYVGQGLSLKPGFSVSAQGGAWFATAGGNVALSPSSDRNYVREETILRSGVTTESQVRSLALGEKVTSFEYFDGVGRPLQSVLTGRSPMLNNIVRPYYYDSYGRSSRSYLGYTNDRVLMGGFEDQAFVKQGSFYASPVSDKIKSDNRPYSEVIFDNSPLGSVLQSNGVGSAWTTKSSTQNYALNVAGMIRIWTVVGNLPVSTSTYPSNMLAIKESTDEEGRVSRTYSDFRGQVILNEVQISESRWAQTYYVYNIYGKLLYMIPPEAAENLAPDAAFVDRWYFQYEYDNNQRQIGFKSPGSGWVYTIYDQWDRPVLTQDANQRTRAVPEWSFAKYDDLNRVVVTGIYATTSTRSELTSSVSTFSGRYEIRNTTAVGYTLNQTYPNSVSESDLLSIEYYDDYGYLSNSGWDQEGNAYLFLAESGYTGLVFNSVKGFSTGRKVKVLNTNTWLNSVQYYDDHYRTLQVIDENHFGKIDRVTNEYDFPGNITQSLLRHNNSTQTIVIQERYSYDLANRPLQVYHKINNQSEVLLSSLEYNELGQMIKKRIHSDDSGSSYLQAIDFRYNIKGSLTNINQTTADAGDPVDYFGMELAYNEAQSGNSVRYDGQISAIRWTHDLSDKRRIYNYTFDKGSLTQSNYKVDGDVNTQIGVFNERISSYDKNGNIISLSRNSGGSTATPIDQLTYNYGSNGGNQLRSVSDGATVNGFKDGNTVGDDYVYDANGNLTIDRNKGIITTSGGAGIVYNLLNLPERINLNNGDYFLYTYDATGSKLSQVFYDHVTNQQSKIDYVSGVVYVDGQPQVISTSEGRIVSPSYANLISNVSTREANSLEGYSTSGTVSISKVSQSGQTYVRAVSGQSGNVGVWPIGGQINVKPGESYSFKIQGYQSTGTNAYLYVWSNTGDVVWMGAQLPVGQLNEGWATSTFTVPIGVNQIKVGIQWNGGGSGNTLYINRVALYKTDWEYQYFLTDHLGSPRVVLQTVPTISTFNATMESENFSQPQGNGVDTGEGAQFLNLQSNREVVLSSANGTMGGTRAYVLNSTSHVGPGRSFRVLPGDVIDASVMAYYASGGTYTKTGLASMASYVATALSGGLAGNIDGVANVSYTNSTGASPLLLLSPNQGSSRPSAFINYILFDETYTPIEAKSTPVGSSAGVLQSITLPSIYVKQTGYVYVYLSYDNDSGQDVYFDEFKIIYRESPVVQINSYYPFGLPAFSWVREGETESRSKYQGKEYETKTQWYDFQARQYDPTLARWFVVDPRSQFSSPYLAMGNNPIIGVDPDGKWVHILVGAVVGGIYNVVANAGNINDAGDFFGYLGVGLAGGAAGAATGNYALAGAIIGGGNAYLQGGSADQIVLGAGIGAFAGGIGGMAAGSVGNGLGGFTQGFVQGAVGGAAGGFTAGFMWGVANTGSLQQGARSGLVTGAYGALLGGIGGGIVGGIRSSFPGRNSGSDPKNFWTGKDIAQGRGRFAINNIPRGEIVVEQAVTTQFGNNPPVRLDYERVYNKMMEHSFSKDHVKSGILELNQGNKNVTALDAILQIERNLPLLMEGNNYIITRVGGQVVTITAFVQNGTVIGGNIFTGTTTRMGGTFIYSANE